VSPSSVHCPIQIYPNISCDLLLLCYTCVSWAVNYSYFWFIAPVIDLAYLVLLFFLNSINTFSLSLLEQMSSHSMDISFPFRISIQIKCGYWKMKTKIKIIKL
jgi:hypothetical protein